MKTKINEKDPVYYVIKANERIFILSTLAATYVIHLTIETRETV